MFQVTELKLSSSFLKGDNDAAFGKAITDSEEDTSNSGIPTPRMSKAPSINNMLDNSQEGINF